MFEVLLSICLAADPSSCREERLDGGATYDACIAAAETAIGALPEGDVAQEWPCVAKGADPAFRVTEVAPGVFVHQGQHQEANPQNKGDLANIGFVVGDSAVAVIDTGGSKLIGEALLASIKARTDLPIRYAVLTHNHPDHIFGTSVFEAEGAAVLGHPALAGEISVRQETYLEANARLIGPSFDGTVPPMNIQPAPESIDLGGRVLRITQHQAAHTASDLTVFDEQTATWFLGDLLFLDHLPAVDASIKGWMAEMKTLQEQEAARVVPGHGPVAVPWPEGASAMNAYFGGLVATIRQQLDDGLSMIDSVEHAEDVAAHKHDWLLYPAFHPRNVTTVYQELEWD